MAVRSELIWKAVHKTLTSHEQQIKLSSSLEKERAPLQHFPGLEKKLEFQLALETSCTQGKQNMRAVDKP